MRAFSFLILLLLNPYMNMFAQDSGKPAEEVIKAIFDNALTDRTARDHLFYLCKNTKGRIPGSLEAAHAVEYTRWALSEAGADTVWLQEVPVPHWERGREEARAYANTGEFDLTVAALGLSVGTGPDGIEKKVVEVKSFKQLEELGRQKVKDRIVFFNRPVDVTLVNTFAGYGSAVDQRLYGASRASGLGAAAVIVRSPTQAKHDFVHTGVVRYGEEETRIPAVGISPSDADLLSELLSGDKNLKVRLVSDCNNYPDTVSYNVIAEIRGREIPDEYITVGGHLDAWDISEGAHDDAGGCVQAIEMIRMYRELGIKPRRSVRAVMFMNEEMTSTGGRVYADEAAMKAEKHYAALESDRGVMSPLGFGFGTQGERLNKLSELKKYFAPYGITHFEKGGGGSDINPLRELGTLQIGYLPSTQRYFWFHHSANDTFEQVNIREMQLGSAAIASLIYLIDLFDL